MIRKEGNIFQLIDSAMHYIIRNIRWRVDLSEDGIHRKEIPEIPIDAIHEAVINSFAHARYDGIVQPDTGKSNNIRIMLIMHEIMQLQTVPSDGVSCIHRI